MFIRPYTIAHKVHRDALHFYIDEHATLLDTHIWMFMGIAI